jgi:predicted nucleic acid-binding protein
VSGFLLDTNVLSEFSRSAIPPDRNVKRWVESAHPDALFTSVLSIGEIRKGIELLAPGKKRSELEHWIDRDLNGWFGNNLLPVTKAISNRWGIAKYPAFRRYGSDLLRSVEKLEARHNRRPCLRFYAPESRFYQASREPTKIERKPTRESQMEKTAASQI